MLYLTGAANSLAKSSEAPQTDVSKSLGGYVSSSIVPNGNINALFDMISLNTLKNKPKETIAIALVNKFDFNTLNVGIKIVTKKNFIGKFKVAVVEIGNDFLMEHIDNRYSEPIQAEFHDVDFYRASVTAKILNPCIAGEIISFQPFDIDVEVEESGMEGTMDAILNAFSLSSDYSANKLSETEFEVISKSENVVAEPLDCLAVCTEDGEIDFNGKYQNGKNNTAFISESLEPNKAIGIWLQRQIVPEKISNEELLRRYNEKVEVEQVEEVELIIDYSIPEQTTDSDITEETSDTDTAEDNDNDSVING